MEFFLSPVDLYLNSVLDSNIGDTSEAEMKSYGLATLASFAIRPPHSLQVEQVVQLDLEGERRPSPPQTFRLYSPSPIPRKPCKWAEDIFDVLLLIGQQHASVKTNGTIVKKSCKRKFSQRQVNTAMRRSSSWGDFFERLEQKYPVYEPALSVCTEMEQLSSFLEFPSTACLSGYS